MAADGTLRLRGLHDPGPRMLEVPSPSPVQAQDEQRASLLLQLPPEIQHHILRFCDYCDIRKLLRTCRRMKAMIDASPRCNRALYRPHMRAWTCDELVRVRTRVMHAFATRPIPAETDGGTMNFAYCSARPDYHSFVHLHPAIDDASWSTEDQWEDVRLLVGDYFTKHFTVAHLALHREAATDPPVRSAQVAFHSATHNRALHIHVEKDDEVGPVTVEDVLRAAVKLTHAWVDTFYHGNAGDDLFANRVWAQGPFVGILESGCVIFTVEVINDE